MSSPSRSAHYDLRNQFIRQSPQKFFRESFGKIETAQVEGQSQSKTSIAMFADRTRSKQNSCGFSRTSQGYGDRRYSLDKQIIDFG
jgi:hypothetical protein